MVSFLRLTLPVGGQIMRLMSSSQISRGVSFSYAIRSFTGYLRGTGKAEHTIASYQSDLRLFERFVHEKLSRKRIELTDLSLADLRRYAEYLRAEGFHDNTRRRRLLTVRRLYRYLEKRGRLEVDLGRRVAAPHKVERVPKIVSVEELLCAVRGMSSETLLAARNRALLWTLLESGCLVSEVGGLRWEHFDAESHEVRVPGKSARSIPISQDLLEAIEDLHQRNGGKNPLFTGFNRHGPVRGLPMTSRGVEMVVKAHRALLGKATPRMLRHSVVIHWASLGHDQETIRKWLGLRTDYAFRAYAPLLRRLKSSDETTSSSDTR